MGPNLFKLQTLVTLCFQAKLSALTSSASSAMDQTAITQGNSPDFFTGFKWPGHFYNRYWKVESIKKDFIASSKSKTSFIVLKSTFKFEFDVRTPTFSPQISEFIRRVPRPSLRSRSLHLDFTSGAGRDPVRRCQGQVVFVSCKNAKCAFHVAWNYFEFLFETRKLIEPICSGAVVAIASTRRGAPRPRKKCSQRRRLRRLWRLRRLCRLWSERRLKDLLPWRLWRKSQTLYHHQRECLSAQILYYWTTKLICLKNRLCKKFSRTFDLLSLVGNLF